MENLIDELNGATSDLSIAALEDDPKGMKEALKEVVRIALLLRELIEPNQL